MVSGKKGNKKTDNVKKIKKEKVQSPKIKKITLRAFSIKNPNLTTSSEVYKNLLDKLGASKKSNDRCLQLNHEDPKSEKDLISFYENSDTNYIFAMIMRLVIGDDAPQVTDALLEQPNFSMVDLDKLKENENYVSNICKDHFYIAINDEFLITNLTKPTTVKRIQTYISWFINNELLEFTPIIIEPEGIQLSDLDSIFLQEPSSDKVTNSNNNSHSHQMEENNKLWHLTKGQLTQIIKSVFNESESLNETELAQLISAQLLIKFRKPKDMTKDDYKRILGAVLKPISDLDQVKFTSKNGTKVVAGKDLLKEKIVEIDLTETGKISEQNLKQEMAKFLIELKNEKETS